LSLCIATFIFTFQAKRRKKLGQNDEKKYPKKKKRIKKEFENQELQVSL